MIGTIVSIIGLVIEFIKLMRKVLKLDTAGQVARNADAIEKVKNAKTPQEKRDAARSIIDRIKSL